MGLAEHYLLEHLVTLPSVFNVSVTLGVITWGLKSNGTKSYSKGYQ